MQLRFLLRLVALCSTLLLWVVSAEAQTPAFTVSGRVVEKVHSTWIGGATVRLSGHPFFITDSDGRFRFTSVTPGPHTLTVEAMGYRSRQLELVARADTALLVEMEVDPIRLDSLLVEAGTITLQGKVADGATGRGIPGARVHAGRAPEVYTYGDGFFRIKELPRGQSTPVVVEAYRYLPARIAIITDQDTTLTIGLEPDSIGIRLFAGAVHRLEIRSRAVGSPVLSLVTLARDHIERSAHFSVYDMIKSRIGRDFSTSCLFIDEVRTYWMEVLDSYQIGEIERIEVFGRGAMVRVYTQQFVASNLIGAQDLPPVVYVGAGFCF